MYTADLKAVLIGLTLRQRTELKAEAQKLGISFNEMVRRILDAHLDEQSK